MMTVVTFTKAYIKSMRLYYSFVTGIAGWLGVVLYENIAGVEFSPSFQKKIIILILLFLSWGINQIFNDYLGIEEDRVNAPCRPMVTGELNPKYALTLSIVLNIATFFIIILFLEPLALIPFILGTALNIAYEYAKGYGIIGNIVFGLMITMGPLFGFLASGPVKIEFFSTEWAAVMFLVLVMNSILTFYTYFKDHEGDKCAGKNTLVVKYGTEKARKIALILGFIPTLLAVIIYFSGFIATSLNNQFIFLFIITAILQIWNGFIYYKNPVGEITYHALEVNFRAYCCGFAMIMALYQPELALMLYLVTYVFIGFLFSFHKNVKG